jgi:GAF domain-containing protein
MTERFTLDRPSFEQVLCATSLIQQLNRRLRNSLTPDNNDIQPLSDLVEAQLAIETGSIDLQAAMNRVMSLAVKLGRATGAATWLFTGQEFVYHAGTGTAANSHDERLQLEVLSKLASICGARDHSSHNPRESNDWSPAPEAIHYPGSVKSLLVAPIYHGRKVAGALAVFSAEFNAFTERDATKARLLSGLLAYALDKAAEAELKQNVSLERAAMLQVIDHLMPALKELAEKDKPESRRSSNRFPSVVTELETVGAAGTILQEAGADVQQSCASTPVLRVAPDGTEPSPLDSPTLQEEKGQTRDIGDNLSPSASLTTEPLRAPESTCAPAPANISTPPIRIQVAAASVHKNAPFGAVVVTKLANRQLSRVRLWLSRTTENTLDVLNRITHRLRISISAGMGSNVRVLSTATQASIVLIMFAFLVLITTAGDRSKTVAAMSGTSAAKLAPDKSGNSGTSHHVTRDLSGKATVSERSQDLHQHSVPVPASQLSHMQVTDPAISSELRTLSRYEIAGLRRGAEYGDDSAALLLGMAYETGHLVPQNCVKAGEWIATSASEGNAAAQYNLGLRYWEGDGVPVNQELGASWLRKAAAQKYAPAQLALKSVP